MSGDSNPLSEAQRADLIRLADAGVKYRVMADAIGRPIGTVKTALYHLRIQGLVSRRYSSTDWSALDA